MRPLRLVMNAFGPYSRAQTVDFTRLGDQSLFLIHGPTGSGKSTILDAICFALYGQTSGNERDGGQMRSDHVDAVTHTEVVFDFALGERTFRVQRRPTYEVRIDETTTRKRQPQAGLWSRNGMNGDGTDGELLASGASNVTEGVQNLLGLRADEFRQVVVLPQGRFRELLTSTSAEREKIFATLFRTGHYRRIQDALKARASEIHGEMRQTVMARDEALNQAGVESADQLQAAIVEIGERITELTSDEAEKRAAESDAREAHAEAVEVDRKLWELAGAVLKLEEIEQQSETVEESRNRVGLARKAAQLRDIEDEVDRLLAAAETSDGERDQIGDKLEQAGQALAEAEDEKKQAEAAQPEIDAATGERNRLEALRPRIERLGEAERAAAETAELATDAQHELDVSSERHTSLEMDLTTAQGKLGSARLREAAIDGLDREVAELTRQLRLRKQLDDASTELVAAREAYSLAVDAHEVGKGLHESAEQRLREMEQAWHDGQAALLAETLAEGEPCPVCGAVHHPTPATSDEPPPDKTALDQLRAEVEQHDLNASQAWQKQVEQEQEVKRLEVAAAKLAEELGEAAEHPVAQIGQAVEDATSKLSSARSAAAEIPGLDQEIERLGVEIEAARSEIAEKQSALTSAQAAAQAASTALELAEAEVPEDYRTIEVLEQAIAIERGKIEALTERITGATQAFDDARSNQQTLAAQHAAAIEEARKDRETAITRQAEFDARRESAGFETEAGYLAAKLHDEEIERLDQGVRAHDEALAIARERVDKTSAAAEELTQPDLENLKRLVDEAEAALEVTIELRVQAGERRTRLTETQARIESLNRDLAKLEADYEVAEYLSGVANGEGRYNRERVSFERFVQAAFLDEVLYVATQRLHTMSGGRFQLERARESSDRRRGSGLELQVFDVHTGTARNVGTLSGGEGFLAALALALGLSEVVQSHAGGIRLDTLFVDEGFGSLDPQALDKALDVLVALQQGRLVGIISHVPELQERIDARLRVRPGRSGSVAELIT